MPPQPQARASAAATSRRRRSSKLDASRAKRCLTASSAAASSLLATHTAYDNGRAYFMTGPKFGWHLRRAFAMLPGSTKEDVAMAVAGKVVLVTGGARGMGRE